MYWLLFGEHIKNIEKLKQNLKDFAAAAKNSDCLGGFITTIETSKNLIANEHLLVKYYLGVFVNKVGMLDKISSTIKEISFAKAKEYSIEIKQAILRLQFIINLTIVLLSIAFFAGLITLRVMMLDSITFLNQTILTDIGLGLFGFLTISVILAAPGITEKLLHNPAREDMLDFFAISRIDDNKNNWTEIDKIVEPHYQTI